MLNKTETGKGRLSMKKKIFMAIGMIAIIVLGAFVYLNVSDTKHKKVRIGVILPLTGNGAIYGATMRHGIELAHNNDPTNRVELLFEDDAGDARTGVSAYNSLTFRGINIIIGGAMSHVASALLPLSNRDRTLLLSPNATNPNLRNIENDLFFRIWPTDDVDGKIMPKYIKESLPDVRRVAIFYPNVDYGVGIMKAFLKNLENSDIEIVFNEGYQLGHTDFRTQILRIRQQNPDLLFMPGYFAEAVVILRQLNELGCDFYVAGVSSFFENDIINAAGNLRDRTFFSYPLFSADSKNPRTQNFIESFRQRHGETPGAFAAYAYDSYNVIRQAISVLDNNKKEITPENLRDALKSLEIINGVTGDYTFDENGDAIKDLQIIWLRDI